MADIHDKEREQERARLRALEQEDLEVESNRGRRPLEGLTGSGPEVDFDDDESDTPAGELGVPDPEHARDAQLSWKASVRQAEGHYGDDEEGKDAQRAETD